MGKAFVIDVAKCIGCHNCQLACKDEHCGNDWTPYAKPQPLTGHFWCKLEENVQGTIPKIKIHYLSKRCNHCRNAPCMKAAKDGAIYRREDGLVIIDPEKAVGQRQIVDACPYGAIYWNEEESLPQKCTGCAHLLDNGFEKPRCVDACPHEALMFGDEEEMADLIAGAQVMMPEFGSWPRVYYRNIPGKFIGGTVYDPVEEEIVEGAKCRLQSGGKTWITQTDEFGDFWFRDLPVGIFNLVINSQGYKPHAAMGLRSEDSLNLGDIPLEREK